MTAFSWLLLVFGVSAAAIVGLAYVFVPRSEAKNKDEAVLEYGQGARRACCLVPMLYMLFALISTLGGAGHRAALFMLQILLSLTVLLLCGLTVLVRDGEFYHPDFVPTNRHEHPWRYCLYLAMASGAVSFLAGFAFFLALLLMEGRI